MRSFHVPLLIKTEDNSKLIVNKIISISKLMEIDSEINNIVNQNWKNSLKKLINLYNYNFNQIKL